MSSEANKRLARRVPEEIATEGNLDRIDEVLAPDFVEHGPFGQEIRGRDEARDQIQSFLDAFPDFEATVDRILAEEDVVAMAITWRGTHEGEFLGIDPTGREFESETAVFTRIEADEIVERWVHPSPDLFRQLGLLDLP
ncbi:ester cyclase [Halosolutus gelatinilyticus]|uniref:ester cyclase n=1 Tax=Halosolutus gelatinilyticus TaxID=2931975 RepID=UPI001FF5B86D|nr:ester cyclase [Halosolutus gelatinilyticus]